MSRSDRALRHPEVAIWARSCLRKDNVRAQNAKLCRVEATKTPPTLHSRNNDPLLDNLFLPPVAAERVSESEHDDFGDGDALDEQQGAIGAEDPQRAFDLAPPIKR